MNDANTTQQSEFVWRRLADSVKVGGSEIDGRIFWLGILLPVLVLGLFYAGWMYRRDARTVGWRWASFMGLLRCTVYGIIALVFLLPAMQNWDETKIQSKVVAVFDVSGSLSSRDDPPVEGMDVAKLPTRQDKVVGLLEGKTGFLARLGEKNPVFSYRFGGLLDEDFLVLDREGHLWPRSAWESRLRNPDDPLDPDAAKADLKAWLNPVVPTEPEDLKEEEKAAFRKKRELYQRLLGATNVGDSVLTAVNRELNNMVQGVIVFSDGHSTEGSAQAYTELAERARKAKIPIFVVGVGQDRPKIRIEITDVQAPDQARPEDKFPVRVEVSGEGLPNREITVYLDIYRPGEDKQPVTTLEKAVKFKPGEPPHAQAEFEIEAAKIIPAVPDDKKKPEFEEGEWKLVARVATDKQEVYVKDGKPQSQHKSDPATVRIVKRPLRVLLFTSAPSHEYQFVSTLFAREVDLRRAELSIYLQPAPGQVSRRPGIVQNVPPDRLLTAFPNRLQDEAQDKPDEKMYNLSAYDLIIAFDPDWTQLTNEQMGLVEKWVGTHAGGLIAVGGPVNTVQLARTPNRDRVKPILDLYPVILEDSRVIDLERNPVEPWRLNFPGANPEMEFLKLEEDNNKDTPLTGWEEFFTGFPRGQAPPNAPVIRGMYNYYPVLAAKDVATVVATFSDPRARLIATNKEMPYLVTMPYGSGKVVWIGSGEMRRLRQYRESYYERFWTKLARYAGSGNLTRINRRIVLVMGRTFTANNYVTVEAQIFGRDMQPLGQNAKPKVTFKLPQGVVDAELTPKDEKDRPVLRPKPGQGEFNGWFTGRFLVRTPGEYGLELKVEETSDTELRKFQVKEANPELDNTRPDFNQLYNLASEADDVLGRVDGDTQKKLKQYLLLNKAAVPADMKNPDAAADKSKDKLRLFFDLKTAEIIPDCMKTAYREQRSRGPVHDMWDDGYVTVKAADPPHQPVKLITVMSVIVTLLSVEWLTRKLLKLA